MRIEAVESAFSPLDARNQLYRLFNALDQFVAVFDGFDLYACFGVEHLAVVQRQTGTQPTTQSRAIRIPRWTPHMGSVWVRINTAGRMFAISSVTDEPTTPSPTETVMRISTMTGDTRLRYLGLPSGAARRRSPPVLSAKEIPSIDQNSRYLNTDRPLNRISVTCSQFLPTNEQIG